MLDQKTKEKILGIFSDFPYLMPGKFYGSLGFSPMYIASRRMFSDPEILKLFAKSLGVVAKNLPVDAVCGVATAGIPLASVVSTETNIPFLYARKERSQKGDRRLVEGQFKKGWRVALIDDATGDGRTKKVFIQNVRQEGLNCNDIIEVYNPEIPLLSFYEKENIKIHSLLKHSELIDYMLKAKRINKELANFFKSPWDDQTREKWSQASDEDWNRLKKMCQENNYPFFENNSD